MKDQRQICPKSYGMAATHIGEVETNTYRPAHILGRPGGEAKGPRCWAINQLVAFQTYQLSPQRIVLNGAQSSI